MPEASKETYVLYGQNRWGRGATVAEAKKRFRNQGGVLSDGYVVLTFDAATKFGGFDEAGRFHYRGNQPTEQFVSAKR